VALLANRYTNNTHLAPVAVVVAAAGAAFIACLEASLAVPQALPSNKQLRTRFIAFLHRMVESLMSSALPYLPPALEALMGSTADATDMTDVLALLVQLMMRFKEGFEKLVEAALPVAVAKVDTLLGGCQVVERPLKLVVYAGQWHCQAVKLCRHTCCASPGQCLAAASHTCLNHPDCGVSLAAM
jgi:hypothetical protein